jgi:hypothetical protein
MRVKCNDLGLKMQFVGGQMRLFGVQAQVFEPQSELLEPWEDIPSLLLNKQRALGGLGYWLVEQPYCLWRMHSLKI